MEQESARGHTLLRLLGGVAVGAAAMYLADPDRGKRRRALAKDKVQRVMARTGGAFDVASRDLGNRVQGLRARATGLVTRRRSRAERVDDAIIDARVRSRIGRTVTHPHAIKVMVYQGRTMLNGPVLAHEKEQLMRAVLSVSGVTSVEDNLQVHDHSEHIEGLQGSGQPRQARALIMRENWPPALRAVASLGGGAMGIYGLARRTPISAVLALLGLGVLARSFSNQPFTRGAGTAGRSAIDVHKTIHIAASPETVFDIWSNYENFPRFMPHVREARDLGDGRSHWVVSGPAGVPVEWTSALTDFTRPEKLAWASEADAPFQHSGEIRFEPEENGTRVSLHMSYRPPAGPIGHAVASLFGGNPRQQMNEDLMRMKSFIENNVAQREAAQPQRPSETWQPGTSLH
jgi:uncharacterized membrane protein